MHLNREQIQYINYLTDTLFYKEALRLSSNIPAGISPTQLEKLLKLGEYFAGQQKTTDTAKAVKQYLGHQKAKTTQIPEERIFYEKLYDYLDTWDVETLLKKENRALEILQTEPEKTGQKEAHSSSPDLYLKNLFFKEFLFHFIQQMKFKGAGERAKSNYQYKK